MSFSRYSPILTVALALAFHSGCGKSEPDKGAMGSPTGKEALTDLVGVLKDFESKKQKPPYKAADIAPIEPLHQAAYVGLVRGDIIYVWGAPMSAEGSSTILAYEKAAEIEGGWVLLQDGTVKKMTAEEIKAAPRAKK